MDFNSIKVRLERSPTKIQPDVSLFQFHKGAIRTWLPREKAAGIAHFNSIKVRLELSIVLKVIMYALFQFHKGAIRTTYADNLLAQGSAISIP